MLFIVSISHRPRIQKALPVFQLSPQVLKLLLLLQSLADEAQVFEVLAERHLILHPVLQDVELDEHEQRGVDAVAVFLAHEVPVLVALLQEFELEQDGLVLVYSSHGVLVGELAQAFVVLCVDGGLEAQHAAPLVAVAEEGKPVDGSRIVKEVFCFYDEFVAVRVGLHEVGELLDALVGDGVAGFAEPVGQKRVKLGLQPVESQLQLETVKPAHERVATLVAHLRSEDADLLLFQEEA